MTKSSSALQAAAAAWTELVAVLNARSTLRDDTPRLSDYALGHFDPKTVIERLLSPEPTYFGYKDILFAGLSAWTVSQDYSHLVEEAMVLAGVSRLADLEEDRQARFPQDALLADIVARLAGPGIDFYRDFYYPAGGLRRVLRARSPHLLKRSLSAASRDIGFAVEMIRVCHDHAVRLQDRRLFRPASFKSGGNAVSNLLKLNLTKEGVGRQSTKKRAVKRSVNGLNCTKKSAPFQPAATLIYAASSILLNNGTLLTAMCTGTASYKKHGHLVEEWIGRSVYVGSSIIESMYTRESSRNQVDFLPSISPIEINAPDLGQGAVIVEEAFATAEWRRKHKQIG